MPNDTVSRSYQFFTTDDTDHANSKLTKGSWNKQVFQQRQSNLSSRLKLTPEQLQESIVAQLNYQVKSALENIQKNTVNGNHQTDELLLDSIVDEAMRSQLAHKRDLIKAREIEKKTLAKEFGIDVGDINEMIKYHEADIKEKNLKQLEESQNQSAAGASDDYKNALNLQKKIDEQNELMAEAGSIQASLNSVEHNELIEDVIDEAYQALKANINDARIFFMPPATMHLMLPHKESGQSPNITQLQFQEAQREMGRISAETEIIICPINDKKSTSNGNDHWTLMVIDRRNPQEIGFHFFNSLKNDKHTSCGRKTADHLFTLMNQADAEWFFKAHKTPQQTGPDSGIFVIENSKVIAERFKSKPKAAIHPIERKDIAELNEVRTRLKKMLEVKFINVLRKIGQDSIPAQKQETNVISLPTRLTNKRRYSAFSDKNSEKMFLNTVGSTYKITINELRGLSDEAILERKDIVLAPAVKGVGTIVKQLSNGDVVVQVSPKRRLDSADPLYLVKATRLKKNSKICLEKVASYEVDPHARRNSERVHEIKEQVGKA